MNYFFIPRPNSLLYRARDRKSAISYLSKTTRSSQNRSIINTAISARNRCHTACTGRAPCVHHVNRFRRGFSIQHDNSMSTKKRRSDLGDRSAVGDRQVVGGIKSYETATTCLCLTFCRLGDQGTYAPRSCPYQVVQAQCRGNGTCDHCVQCRRAPRRHLTGRYSGCH